MEEIRKIKASIVEIVDIDDICENGIVCEMDKVNAIVDKMKNRKIDALFFPFCDFGEEQVVAAIASKFTVPILIWGPRDERPNTDEARGRDTQCGMFAATKVLQRYGLKYSYIYNCTTKSEEFLKGYETFIRTAAVLKSLRTLRIAKIGERPVPFMSVMTNEANLIKRFGITTVPISPVEICNRARKILEEKGKEYIKYEEEFVRKFPDGENYQQICATKLAVQELMEENNCSVAAFECWSAFPTLMGLCPCVVLGEMADNGMPLSCETDINGAITLVLPVSFGAMLMESMLAIIALIAVASFADGEAAAQGLTTQPQIFAGAIANFLSVIGLPHSLVFTLINLAVSAFALTSLDSVARVGRLSFQEFFLDSDTDEENMSPFLKVVTNKYFATIITLVLAYLLTKVGYAEIWPLFGSANQLLSVLALVACAVFLKKTKRQGCMLWIPMVFMMAVTFTALGMTISKLTKALFTTGLDLGNTLQLIFAVLLLILGVLVAIQGVKKLFEKNDEKQTA